jgi:hypothetical protein
MSETPSQPINQNSAADITEMLTINQIYPLAVLRGIYFYCDRDQFIHVFCNIDITPTAASATANSASNNSNSSSPAASAAALACWFGPDHCL